jgi:hypothetical protein
VADRNGQLHDQVITKDEVREQIRGAESGPPLNVRVPDPPEFHLNLLPQPSILERLTSSFSRDAILPAFDLRTLRSREWRAGAALTVGFHVVFAALVIVVGWHALTKSKELEDAEGPLVAGPLLEVKEAPGPDNNSSDPAKGAESSASKSGGGQKEPAPATAGVKPAVAPMPPLPPSPKLKPVANPSLALTPAVKGPIAEAPETGDPGLRDGVMGPPSMGDGDNGGIGGGDGGGTGDGKQSGTNPNGPGGPGGFGGGPSRDTGSSIGTPNGGVSGGGGSLPDRGARMIRRVRAVPTAEMRANGTLGDVRLSVLVGPKGEILNVTPLQQLANGGTQAAIDTVRRCTFEGAIRNGVPVAEKLVLMIRFHTGDGR